ncbi:hypothetical protein BC332_11090 [Capsicum chinense]|nr:hypothetical protein BC332_11090 [Capsicum chinense]
MEETRYLFNELTKRDHVYNLMIKGYVVSGQVEVSKQLFLEMSERNLTSINTMIFVYSRNGEIDKAVELLEEVKVQENCVLATNLLALHFGQNHSRKKAENEG